MCKRFLVLCIVFMLCFSLFSHSFAAENTAPVAENLELETYRNTSVGGRLSAVDPEGDLLTFEITTKPAKGEVTLEEDGSFTYTPHENKKGRDYFGYRATDSSGSRSQEATVLIKIEKQKTKVCYNDLIGRPEEYAAVWLAENGLYTGANTCGQYHFSPDAPISRGEFLALCMQLSNEEILTGVTRTGFADDTAIPGWVKPYVSTALMAGSITGYSTELGAVFRAEEPIGYYEALVMVSNTLGSENTVSVGRFTDEESPDWAARAVSSLSACGVLRSSGTPVHTLLTRGEAACLLSAAAESLK